MAAQTHQEKLDELERDERDAQDVATEYIPPAKSEAPKGKKKGKAAPVEEQNLEQEEAEFRSLLDTKWPILGTIVGVQCTVPGYEWLKVWFRISNQHWIAKLFRQVPAVDNLIFTIFPLFVRGLEIAPTEDATPTEDEAAAIAALDATSPATYQLLFEHAYDLLIWMRNDGYDAALKKPVGN